MKVTDYYKDYIDIGYTKKTSGVKGFLKLNIEDRFADSLGAAKHCFLMNRGCMVPYFIDTDPDTISDGLIKFECTNNPQEARQIVSKTIYLHKNQILQHSPLEQEAGFSIVKYYQLVDDETEEIIGKIVDVVQYPEQEMAIVDAGNKEIMIPLNIYNVKGINPEEELVFVEIPDGLLEL